jgi:hypothetical protein
LLVPATGHHALPAWLPVAKRPDGAMLLHHLSNWHLVEARPYLRRMATEAIGAVVMEAFERVRGARAGEEA